MKSYYNKSNNSRIIAYTVLIALVLGIGFVVIQDIQAPTEHILQEVTVSLDK
ncbi:MAG: hypothetical protein IJS88_03895 [Alphaproteobacteria bacterium]|nr:hypothetical protein [Alphaproteobacteria bacterium]